MKRFTTLSKLAALLLVFIASSLTLSAQTDVFNKVSSAIASGNDAALAAHFNSTVEVTLPGADQSYSAQQAQFVVKGFFAKYPVTAFKLNHNGESGGTWYATGVYSSASGNFDTNIFLKKVGEKFAITQIRFEQD